MNETPSQPKPAPQSSIRWFTSTKLWRAFPELDPFSDEQCRPVITFVSRSSLDQLCCIGLALLGTIVSGFLVVGVLRVRDMLLRHHLRKLLTSGSTCIRCSYSLLGLPLDEQHRATCPECGTSQDVHKAFASLAPGR